MYLKKLITLTFIASTLIAFGQDIHFSQFQYSPLNLSPSLAGKFNGDYRFAFNQKTQWKSVTKPFVTYSLSGDAKNLIGDKISTGILILNDKTGDSEFNTFQANIINAISIPLKVNTEGGKHLSFGLLTGYTQKKLDYSNLQFDNQFNGTNYDPSLSNNENFDTNKKQYLNIHSGISFHNIIDKRNSYLFGIAANNLTNPDEQFYNNNDQVKLSTRLNFFGEGDFLLSEKFDVLPSLLLSKQNTYSELIFGSQIRYRIEDTKEKNIAARGGFFYRNQDATFISLGLEYNRLTAGVSYDINLSTLKTASLGKGGFEFSLIYILEKFVPKINGKFSCPSFI